MAGHWEAVVDPDTEGTDNEFWRVRWSEKDAIDQYLYVRHYGSNGTAWNRSVAERQAQEFNDQNKRPSHFTPNFRHRQ